MDYMFPSWIYFKSFAKQLNLIYVITFSIDHWCTFMFWISYFQKLNFLLQSFLHMDCINIFICKYFPMLNKFSWWCSHSDTSLDELGKDAIKEDDRAILLETGLSRSASAKSHASSVKLNLIRSFFTICTVKVFFFFQFFTCIVL